MKRFLSMLLVVVLTATLAVSGTLAYLQDDDSDVNVMTLGNVYIEQHEYEREVDADGNYVTDTNYGNKLKEYTQGKPLLPATELNANGNAVVDDNHVHNDGEAHHKLSAFDYLFGGPVNHRYCYCGINEHPGVTVIYNK